MKQQKSNSCSESVRSFCVGGISLSPDAEPCEAFEIVAKKLRRAGMNPARLRFDIFKKSVDARKKNDVRLVYSVRVSASDGSYAFSQRELDRIEASVSPVLDSDPEIRFGEEHSEHSPLVVGMGPAGLFCALMLAENGYAPTLIDRGDGIAERCKRTDVFFCTGELDTESNVQFGAGGAGTFSDGKLVTRVNDARVGYILRRFCDFGAPEDIKISAKPHIGTDLLVGVVDGMLRRIEQLGGKVMYRCKLLGLEQRADGSVSAKTSSGDVLCSCAVLATGHSARDVYSMLMSKNFLLEAKPFSVGLRIEHLQRDIDKAMFGDFAGHPRIGKGEYHLSDTSSGRGVYTFCMCPGGQVVAAASEHGGVVVNGMSHHARDGENANSAILASVRPEDHGGTCESAIEFQRRLERAAYEAGGGDYYAPCQTVGDFLRGEAVCSPDRIRPTYRQGRVREARLDRLLPEFAVRELRLGLLSFDKKISGFAASDAPLTGVETRSSAPVRVLRDSETLCAPTCGAVYPCGEGAGYAGGITSAAIDGIRVAQAIMARFARREQ